MNEIARSLVLFSCTTLTCSLHALVERSMDEKKPISISLSTTSHNRVSVEGGSVEKIFGDDSHFQVTLDQMTGNAFIDVVKPIDPEKPITLTLVTTGGLIQDLLVTSQEGFSEHLVLKEIEEKEDFVHLNNSLQNHTVELLNTILQGRVPLGYGEVRIEDQASKNMPLPEPLQGTLVKVLEGPLDMVKVYKIRNTKKTPIVVTTDALKTEEMSWLFLTAHELQAHEEILCLISFAKKES